MDVPGRPGGPRVLRPRPVLTRSLDDTPTREPCLLMRHAPGWRPGRRHRCGTPRPHTRAPDALFRPASWRRHSSPTGSSTATSASASCSPSWGYSRTSPPPSRRRPPQPTDQPGRSRGRCASVGQTHTFLLPPPSYGPQCGPARTVPCDRAGFRRTPPRLGRTNPRARDPRRAAKPGAHCEVGLPQPYRELMREGRRPVRRLPRAAGRSGASAGAPRGRGTKGSTARSEAEPHVRSKRSDRARRRRRRPRRRPARQMETR